LLVAEGQKLLVGRHVIYPKRSQLTSAIRIEVAAPLTAIGKCDCSLCTSSGFLQWKVPKSAVRIVIGESDLKTYKWTKTTFLQHFCRKCGAAMFRTNPSLNEIVLNARCVDGFEAANLPVTKIDAEEALH
jgi:hypothetical protein